MLGNLHLQYPNLLRATSEPPWTTMVKLLWSSLTFYWLLFFLCSYGYRQLLEGCCADIIQPDITWLGGITEVKLTTTNVRWSVCVFSYSWLTNSLMLLTIKFCTHTHTHISGSSGDCNGFITWCPSDSPRFKCLFIPPPVCLHQLPTSRVHQPKP